MPRVALMAAVAIAAATPWASTVEAAVKLPLTWVDRQAYVATTKLNGESLALHVGTWTSDIWVACRKALGKSCSLTCPLIMDSELRQHCVTETRVDSLAIEGLTMENVAVSVLQYHDLEEEAKRTDVPSYMLPNYSSEQPSVLNSTHGVLGLGRNSSVMSSVAPPKLQRTAIVDQYRYFSLFLASSADGSGSFVHLGGGIDDETLAARSLTTAYSLPLCTPVGADEIARDGPGWLLSIVAVRFDENELLYPRSYGANEVFGSDAIARLSLNHAVLQMPSAVFDKFYTNYLSACSRDSNIVVGVFYTCATSIIETLPRIGLYLNNKSFYLDPVDYTHASPSKPSLVVVEIASSKDNARWVLGTPFLKKFPTTFRVDTQSVEVHCAVGSTCRPMATEAMDRVPVVSSDAASSAGSSSNTTDTFRPTYSPIVIRDSESDYPTLVLVVLWIGRCVGFLIILSLVYGTVRSCIMGRRRGFSFGVSAQQGDDAMTMASERDLDEAKAELRRMVAEEEAAMADGDGSVPGTPTYAAASSPRRV